MTNVSNISRDTLKDIFELSAEAKRENYIIQKQTLADVADEVRMKECSTNLIPVSELGKRRRLATAIPYSQAQDGDKLYEANFESGTYQLGSGSNWLYAINGGADVSEGYTLEIDRTKAAGYYAKYIGKFPMYDLENKTYTLDFEYFKKLGLTRHRVYFANGVFLDSETGGTMNGGRCMVNSDGTLYCLGFQIVSSNTYKEFGDYRFVDNANNWSSTNINQPTSVNYKTMKLNGEELSTNFKIVLRGGARKENVTIYHGNGTIPTANVTTWTGDVIPIYFTIYNNTDKAAEGLIYQPADIPLVFGIGCAETPTASQYCGVRNLVIYKGDIGEG